MSNNNYTYFPSSQVRIFPCNQRGTYTIKNGADEITRRFDPEATRVSEYNFTHLPGILPGKKSYKLDFSDGVLRCVIAGYYIEISDLDSDLTTGALSLGIESYRVQDAAEGGDSERYSQQLCSLKEGCEGLDVKDGTDYIFTALAYSSTSAHIADYPFLDLTAQNYNIPAIDDIPTKVSQLTNDSEYITATELADKRYLTETDLTAYKNSVNTITKAVYAGRDGKGTVETPADNSVMKDIENLQTLTTDGAVENGNNKLVTGGAVYTAVETAKNAVVGNDTDDAQAHTVAGAKAYAKDYADQIKNELLGNGSGGEAGSPSLEALDSRVANIETSLKDGGNTHTAIKTAQDAIDEHKRAKTNPHEVTAAQLGVAAFMDKDLVSSVTEDNGNAVTSGAVFTAISEAISGIKGTTADGDTAETIAGAKKYADTAKTEAIATVIGTDADDETKDTIKGIRKALADVDDNISNLKGTKAENDTTEETIAGAKAYADQVISTIKGTDNDAATADTIKGAKKYAEKTAAEAESNAKTYADNIWKNSVPEKFCAVAFVKLADDSSLEIKPYLYPTNVNLLDVVTIFPECTDTDSYYYYWSETADDVEANPITQVTGATVLYAVKSTTTD